MVKNFNYYQPTRIIFGVGRRREISIWAKRYGKKVLVVVDPNVEKFLAQQFQEIIEKLHSDGIETVVFDHVIPNPTLDSIQEGAEIAKKEKVELVIGIGGGSTIDTAKAIAVAATHEGNAWNYLYFKKEPTEKTLPIIGVPTTSGTGTQTSRVAVLTNTEEKSKSAIVSDNIICKVAIVDPELTLTMPPAVTASTGFDVFTHCFESYININNQPYVDMLALEAIKIVIEYSKKVYSNPNDIEARTKMAWADTLGGCCLANVGTTIPHALGQAIGGHFPHVSHGQSLAVVYPSFLDYTVDYAIERFAKVARMFNPELEKASDKEAAYALKQEIISFLKSINLYYAMEDFGIKKEDIKDLVNHAIEFPDNRVNPRVPDEKDLEELYLKSFKDYKGQ